MSEYTKPSAPRTQTNKKPYAPYREDRPLKVLRGLWHGSMQNNHAAEGIDRVNFSAPKQEGQGNVSSLASALESYPSLVDSFDPDYENLADCQLAFGDTLLNRAEIVYQLVNAPAINSGLIQYE